MSQPGIAWRFARRELRGGLRGFWIFLACLTLGVGAIGTVQSVSKGVLDALREDGRTILGGDLAIRTLYEPAPDAQEDAFAAAGSVTRFVDMRSMARAADSAASALVELKAVQDNYPLYGEMRLKSGADLHGALAYRDGLWGVVAEPLVLERLGVDRGDQIKLGEGHFVIRGVIEKEPDRAASGTFTLGPRLMLSTAALETTGLIQPGSLVYYNYRLKLPGGRDAEAVQQRLRDAFPTAPWQVRTYRNASPQLSVFVSRLTLFLTMTGLTALLVGGVGVGNAVRAYLDGKTATIATLKCVGAPGPLIFRVYFLQVLVLALLGIAVGLAISVLAPLGLAGVLDQVLPVETRIRPYPGALALATLAGLLTTLTFAIWPTARAREIPAAQLFRDQLSPANGRPRPAYLAAIGLAACGLIGTALASTDTPLFALYCIIGAALTMLTFLLAGGLIRRGARAMGRPRRPALRLAITNLHRPGAPTGAVTLSLGLGLTVLVTIALIEGNLSRQIEQSIPEQAPAFFFVDIQPDQRQPFRALIAEIPGTGALEMQPSLRGRITAANGTPAEQALVDPSKSWVLRGDRGITYGAAKPENAEIIAGEWWSPAYNGPPLLSVEDDIAEAFGIGVGDELTVTIVGRPITGTIGNIRETDWGSLSLNFTIGFAPGALETAPQTSIATLRAASAAEGRVQARVTEAFPNITAIRVREALDTVNGILGKIGLAIRLTAAVTLVAGTLVLAGAMAAGHRRRVYDAVVLKVLGATRATVLRSFLLEYGLLGLMTAAIAGVAGTIAAWSVIRFVMRAEWTFLPGAVLSTAALCTAITLIVGFAATWRAMGQKPAPLLRNE